MPLLYGRFFAVIHSCYLGGIFFCCW